jgi:hypothetical protein
MGRLRQGNKETKKTPVLNAREKKAAKLARKHAGDVVPIIPR